MDKLKQFIEDHRDEFDDIQLPEGHFERFEKKMRPPRRQQPFRLWFLTVAAVAACIAALFILRLPVESLMDESAVCEIEEVQLFYRMQMNNVLSRIEKIHETDQSQTTAKLLEVSREILIANEQFEEKILPELPCSEEGVFAMNQHYNNSISSLNTMLEQMERVAETDNNIP